MSDSIDAEIIEMPDTNETLVPATESYIESTPIEVSAKTNNAPDFTEHSNTSSTSLVLDSGKLDFLDDIIAQKSACTDEVNITNSNTTEVVNLAQTNSVPVTDHLNAVVESAVQALQDWLTLRQHSEDNSPATQGLAQLDILLDTVTHQQQQLAEQLNNTPKINFSGMASALGVSLPTPQAMGWSHDEWRNKAQNVAHKTDDIAAMNAKLRKQLEQF
jgi:ornithine carbamoyltransferase